MSGKKGMRKTTIFAAFLLGCFTMFHSQEVIENPDKSQNPNAGRILKTEEVLRITDGNGEYYFKRPSRLQIADDGSIFVVDEDQFLKFSPQAVFIKNLYKKGQGPGEIQGSFSYSLRDDDIYLYNRMNSKILHMDQDGRLIEEFRFENRYIEFIGLWTDHFVFSKSILPDMEEWKGQLFNVPVKIVLISNEEKVIRECFGIPERIFLHPNIAINWGRSISIISEDGKTCFISDPEKYMVSVLNLDKLEYMRKFGRDYPRVKRPKVKPPPQMTLKIPERRYLSDIVYLYTFQENLWVRTSTNNEKKGTLYDVFDSTGRYSDCFWLDVGESLITTHGDYLFVREQSEDGDMSLVKYKVVESSSVLGLKSKQSESRFYRKR